MMKLPAVEIVSRPIATNFHHVAIREFGSYYGNSYAAWIIDDRQVRINVAQPEVRSSWDHDRESAFREAVIALATLSPWMADATSVSIILDPESHTSLHAGYDPATAPTPDIVIR